MTLLYRGKIREAEESLNQLVSTHAIDPNTEARYRHLLKQARQYEAAQPSAPVNAPSP